MIASSSVPSLEKNKVSSGNTRHGAIHVAGEISLRKVQGLARGYGAFVLAESLR